MPSPLNFLSRIIWLSLPSTVPSGSLMRDAMWEISTRLKGSIRLQRRGGGGGMMGRQTGRAGRGRGSLMRGQREKPARCFDGSTRLQRRGGGRQAEGGEQTRRAGRERGSLMREAMSALCHAAEELDQAAHGTAGRACAGAQGQLGEGGLACHGCCRPYRLRSAEMQRRHSCYSSPDQVVAPAACRTAPS